MNICVIGAGHVGLVTAACLADMGNRVFCVDCDQAKIAKLKKKILPFYEPGLRQLVARNVKNKRLLFSGSLSQGLKNSLVIFIAVSTPPKASGEADLKAVKRVTLDIARHMNTYHLVVQKSTVPVETGKWVKHMLKIHRRKDIDFDIASNPEFLREGSAIKDFMYPDRIILGVESKRAEKILRRIFRPLKAPVVVTNIQSAEIIKHAANSFLATKVSFINAVSRICEKVQADVVEVACGIGMDKRIERKFLRAGCGYGGSCFPKDIDAFIYIAKRLGYNFELLKAVKRINQQQRQVVVNKVKLSLKGIKNKTIAVLGLSFKPNTDDLRFAPALEIIRSFKKQGAKVKAYDPCVIPKPRGVFRNVELAKSPYAAARGSDCLVIVTEWNEFKTLNLRRIKNLLKNPLIVDGRNIYDPRKVKRLGIKYVCVGRGKYD